MFNDKIMAVIRREVKSKLTSKSFILGTLSMPLIMALMMGFNYFLMKYDGDEGSKVTIVTNSEAMKTKLQDEFAKKDFVKNKSYILDYKTVADSEFENSFKNLKSEILTEKINAVLYVPDSSIGSKKVFLYSASAKNISMEERLSSAVNAVFIGKYFEGKDVNSDDIKYAEKNVDFSSMKVSEKEKTEEENGGQLVLAYIFTFILYISLLMIGSMMMQSVIEEKQNRIVEVLLSSMKAKDFMTGKIMGSVITGVFQMAVWIAPIVIILGFSLPVIPKDFIVKLDWIQIAYFMINFFIGLAIFLSLFGTIGAIFDNPQEAQSGMMPVMMLIILPFFVSFTLIKNPANPIGMICSFLPFFNIILMPVRMTVIDVPLYQPLVAFIINLLTFYFIFPIAGKIYQVGILTTGKKPSWKEVFSWLKINY